MKNHQLDRAESKIKECIEHLEFLKKGFELFNDISNYFSEKNIEMPYHKFDDVSNFHLLFVITELEINLCLKNYYNSKSSIEKKYCLKSGFLIIYEFNKTLNSNKNIINKLCDNNEKIKKNYKEITIKLRSFRKEISLNTKIKNIRNMTAGHFNTDLKEFLDIVDSIDEENDIIMFYELGLILHQFNIFLLQYIYTDDDTTKGNQF